MDFQTIACTIAILFIAIMFTIGLNKVTPSSKKYEK